MDKPRQTESLAQLARATGVVIASVLIAGGLTTTFIMASDIVFILFLGILFGVFLTQTSGWLSQKLPFGQRVCAGLMASSLLLICIFFFAAFGVKVEQQVSEADQHLAETKRQLTERVANSPLLQSTLASTPLIGNLIETSESSRPQSNPAPSTEQTQRDNPPSDSLRLPSGGTLKTAANQVAMVVSELFQTTFGLLINSALIFFVGLFLAMAPTDYRDGVVLLFPKHRRQRATEIMDALASALWHWLTGRFGSMVVTGIGASVILLSCGVPLAFLLGLATALLTFVPNIGGLVALILAVLFAVPQGVAVVAIVVIGYGILQLVESYLVTPLIQQQQASLPPALLISFQALMGVLFGFLGAAVASPLLAAGKKFVQEAYVRDTLRDQQVS